MKRRNFFKLMGIASGAALSACKINNADKKLLPYLVPPEDDVIPGIPRYIRSTCMECPAQCGINIKIRDDKPVKLEGNPEHPINKGALCVRGQASLAKLYHPNRIKQPLKKTTNGKFIPISWEESKKILENEMNNSIKKGLQSIFLSSRTTGTLSQLIDEFCSHKNMTRLKEIETLHYNNIKQANQSLFNTSQIPHFHINNCDSLITIGADLFETFLSPVEWAKQYTTALNQSHFDWIHIEPYLTLTGASAKKRIPITPNSEAFLLAFLINNIKTIKTIPTSLLDQIPKYTMDQVCHYTHLEKNMVKNILNNLTNAQRPLIISGGPAINDTNGYVTCQYTSLIQWALGMTNGPVDFNHAFNYKNTGGNTDFQNLIEDCRNHKIGFALFSRMENTPAISTLHNTLANIPFKVIITDITSPLMENAQLILPSAHTFESWGDAEPYSGIQSIIQPALLPPYQTKSEGDILLNLLDQKQTYQEYLANQWQEVDESWIQKGFKIKDVIPNPLDLQSNIKLLTPQIPERNECLYIIPSLRTFDGRSTAIDLLMEIPDPLSATSYGQWISISSADAKEKNLSTGDVIEINFNTGKIKAPVNIIPGPSSGVLTITFDAWQKSKITTQSINDEIIFCLKNIKIIKTGEKIPLPILAGAKVTGNRNILPHTEEKAPHHHKYKRYTLYPPHQHKDYRWGMCINLDLCIGCSACVAACYIENNIPMVGINEQLKGREMSWLRIETYFNNMNQPEFIPMMCQQCDNAPCETVCPVFATYHNPEGLNAQIYNRCVGTRYCANNCPYKARRFNWFDHAQSLPLYQMSNPDLSVRPKGVMEKCTFCIQRIRYCRDQAKDENRKIQDGEVIPACAQTCPTNAITFGNLMDPQSKVSQLIKSSDIYRIQELLGTEPAIYYFKKNSKGLEEA